MLINTLVAITKTNHVHRCVWSDVAIRRNHMQAFIYSQLTMSWRLFCSLELVRNLSCLIWAFNDIKNNIQPIASFRLVWVTGTQTSNVSTFNVVTVRLNPAVSDGPQITCISLQMVVTCAGLDGVDARSPWWECGTLRKSLKRVCTPQLIILVS
jgi:hypothetical protein